ncbi:MAG: hypothetical protein KZQ83_16970, partial [gamma proteobacterium symbiont of Taylorina sp.]|nr:hypothetical protein [gamma proteobacterium symbiont of Taylorina sp.]
AGLHPNDITGIFKVSQFDSTFSVLLANTDTVNKIDKLGQIKTNKVTFDVMKMDEQIVNIRIHWLPLYYTNTLIKAMLCEYGEVMDVRMMHSTHEKVFAFNGVREVRLKTDEVHRQRVPHMIKFTSGQSALITMYGRPPLCLKCLEVGHVRVRCPRNLTYARSMENNQETEPPATVEKLQPENVSGGVSGGPPAPVPAVEPTAESRETESTGSVDVSATQSSGSVGSGVVGPSSEHQPVETEFEEMEADSRLLKRGRDDEELLSWITPNKTAKSRTVSQLSVPVLNTFTPIMCVEDILSQGDD